MDTSRLVSSIVGLALAITVTQASHAVVLLSDNFDGESTTSQLDFNGFDNWTVDNGTVDWILSGQHGITCAGGSGGCVDSDGSSEDAGRLLSQEEFELPAGTPFTISLDVSGNQRNSASDALFVGIRDELGGGILTQCTRLGTDPFSSCGFSNISNGFPFRASIEGLGNDNIGAVFDNFLLTADIAQASEPVTLALLGIGLAGLGFGRRKRAT